MADSYLVRDLLFSMSSASRITLILVRTCFRRKNLDQGLYFRIFCLFCLFVLVFLRKLTTQSINNQQLCSQGKTNARNPCRKEEPVAKKFGSWALKINDWDCFMRELICISFCRNAETRLWKLFFAFKLLYIKGTQSPKWRINSNFWSPSSKF